MILEKIQYNASLYPEKQALVFREKTYTYQQLLEEIERRKAKLSSIEQKVVVLNNTCVLENILHFLSLLSLQKIGIFLPTDFTFIQRKEFLEDKNYFLLDEAKLAHLEEKNTPKIALKNKIETLFLGVLSSGTEGKSKVIWKDYQSWVSAFEHQSEVFGISQNDRIFVLNALAYSANLNTVLHGLWAGATLVFGELKTASTWPFQLQNQQISSIFLVPSHYRLLPKSGFVYEGLQSAVSAGEKLDIKTAQNLLNSFPKARLTEYYGAAELGHVSYQQNEDIINYPHSVGKAFPEVKIEIVANEIRVKSPYISPDYRHINTVLDLGYWDNERLVLLGRSGRIFNKRGLNVFAEEIENAAQCLDVVHEAAVVGKKQNNHTESIILCFSPSEKSTKNNTKLLKEHLLNCLPLAKQPKKIIEFQALPHKNSGKIDLQALKKLVEEDTHLNHDL